MDQQHALSALSALGQESRLDTIRLLVRAGDKGMAAGEISESLGIVQNTLSTHLSILAKSGLVKSQREGRTIRYFADMDGMCGLMGYLLEDCCAGQVECCDGAFQCCAPAPKETVRACC
ncbi:winged helix-turn-helix transcriptional regulator [Paracoccus aurantiacus]|uniref:Winged helix-turn-helix transcriptional regulator n=1 Tax=Paracoccus aurantiacus TaxID=2599412 RepID=A0A5C6S6S8_9RHOB|nr:winged helix-turn-helix domain-containing protein [Paracoccus aurantiacus]TXB70063.1 winged helix-turn-helix transcriptional regulator [Paracoccus aurantiacus]